MAYTQNAIINIQTVVCMCVLHRLLTVRILVHVPNFGGLSGSEDRGGGDNSI